MTQEQGQSTISKTRYGRVWKAIALLACLLLFALAISLLSVHSRLLGSDLVLGLIKATSNPFIGLFVGILATAILQSSSTTTSLVVALVAGGSLGVSTDAETIGRVIPFIMGANIGTTVTSSMVSLGHISSRREYRKAIAAATVHDLFNIFTAIVLFPLEMAFGILSRPAAALTSWIQPDPGGDGGFGFMDFLIRPVALGISQGLKTFLSGELLAVVGMLVALTLLFLVLRWINRLLKSNLMVTNRETLSRTIFRSPLSALGWGTLLTSLVQSSSVVTSLVVPLVARDRISMNQAFPFIMGANMGTTTTALLAALLVTGVNPGAAVAIALTHVLFNVYGVLLIFPIPRIRMLPIQLSRRLGAATLSNRLIGILYILVVFFLLPFLMVLLSGA